MRCIEPTTGVLLSAAVCVSSHAATLNESNMRFATNFAAGDKYGYAVALSGDTAVVVANRDPDRSGLNVSSAYVLDVTTGQTLFELTGYWDGPSNSVRTASISGNTAVIGAHRNAVFGQQTGMAQVFDTSTGAHQMSLIALDGQSGDGLGWSVAISGDTVIAGAIGDDDAGSGSGSAYLFDAVTGDELFKLTASDAQAGDLFGYSVGIGSSTAVVGANRSGESGSLSGSAYVYDVDTGNELYQLTPKDAAPGDQFGWSAAMSGSIALIGAPGNSDAGTGSGAAYAFDTTTGEELFKFTASDAAANDQFGSSVAMSGSLAVVGAHGNDHTGAQSGAAYVFDITTGQELFKLRASDAAPGDLFGFSVAVSGSNAVIGAWADGDAGALAGSAYIFEAIPEPASMTLVAGGGLILIRRSPTTG